MPDVRLTKEQRGAWSDFGPEWDPLKAAWLRRGLLWPPSGESTDGDDESQRGLLWQVLDAQPTNLPRWVAAAPGTTAKEVVAHVLAQWHEVRDAVGPSRRSLPRPVPRTAQPMRVGEIAGLAARRAQDAAAEAPDPEAAP